jgi:hypothetical protein
MMMMKEENEMICKMIRTYSVYYVPRMTEANHKNTISIANFQVQIQTGHLQNTSLVLTP